MIKHGLTTNCLYCARDHGFGALTDQVPLGTLASALFFFVSICYRSRLETLLGLSEIATFLLCLGRIVALTDIYSLGFSGSSR